MPLIGEGVLVDCCDGGAGRQEEGEDGAVVDRTKEGAEAHLSLVFFDDLFRDPEAEAGAGIALGGDERLEECALDAFRDTCARVCDEDTHSLDTQAAVMGDGQDTKAERAAGGHGVDSVLDEVGDDLADLSGGAEDTLGGAEAALDADAGGEQAGVEECEDRLDDVAE